MYTPHPYIIIFTKMQDYPSVGQIIQKARENDVNVIFVIGGNESSVMRANYYDELARQLPGAINNASALSNDSKNIIDIIRENYRVIFFINNSFQAIKYNYCNLLNIRQGLVNVLDKCILIFV